MKRRIFGISGLIFCAAVPSISAQTTPANLDEVAAKAAAEQILRDLGNQQFKRVYEQETCAFAKQNFWTENQFIANMSAVWPNLGAPSNIYFIGDQHASSDPVTKFQGSVWAITYRCIFPSADLFIRVVVAQDQDGQYRLSGIFANPVPQNTPLP